MCGECRPIVITLTFLILSGIIYAEFTGIPGNQHPPNGLVDAKNKIDYSDLSIALINDLVLIAQIFVTCVPTGALAPVAPNFVRVSCMFNLLSALSLLALSILIGWDKMDESRTFKLKVRQIFDCWAARNTRYPRRSFNPEVTALSHVREFSHWLDLHFDIFVKSGNQRLLCGIFEMGENTLFSYPGFTNELCVTKEGLRKLGENRFSTLPLNTLKKLTQFLIRGGLLRAAINPPLFLLSSIQIFGNLTQEVQQRIYQMTTLIEQEAWNGRDIGFTIQEDQKLLLTFRYSSHRLV
ncbi:hypothetical protein HG536_0D04810 [Torulaspora globosa]|uniref:Uncharacterized protein n=1 Tax=Torulaspora globosa TaxID=48254 RepID=A0A7G3ZHH3_9SACH|nr:uncharacterized protein HG536_0D04810 [Torulaspora globosa]QLL32959.1 hypothetical protein HG536_0D04810 [Torulaspora globosa]